MTGSPCTPVVLTAMPLIAGDIAPGGTKPTLVSIDFTGCPSLTFFRVTANINSNGGATPGVISRTNQVQ